MNDFDGLRQACKWLFFLILCGSFLNQNALSMNRLSSLFSILFLLTAQTLAAQGTFNCDQYFIDFYKNKPDRPVTDLDAFCEGAYEAHNAAEFVLKFNSDPNDIKTCVRHSYEQQGVNLVCIGRTNDPKTLDALAGYNYVAEQRIRAKLGNEGFEQLGMDINPFGFGPEDIFTEQFYDEFNRSFVAKKEGNGAMRIRLENRHLFPDYIDHLKVKDRRTETAFTFADLWKPEGVVVPIADGDRNEKNKLFNFILTDFTHPNYCKTKNMPEAFIVWVKLTDFF